MSLYINIVVSIMSYEKKKNYIKEYVKTEKGRLAFRKAQKKYTEKLRANVIELLGGKCVVCGFNDPRALQIDHIHGGGTRETAEIGIRGIYRKILKNPDGYQLLCSNCNWIKRYEQKEVRKA